MGVEPTHDRLASTAEALIYLVGNQHRRIALFLIPHPTGAKDKNDKNDKSTTERKLHKDRRRDLQSWSRGGR
jgi:hypothetical protein